MKDFNNWFHELEGYSLRSERFYGVLGTHKYNDTVVLAKTLVDWLHAAYNQGKLDQINEQKTSLR